MTGNSFQFDYINTATQVPQTKQIDNTNIPKLGALREPQNNIWEKSIFEDNKIKKKTKSHESDAIVAL